MHGQSSQEWMSSSDLFKEDRIAELKHKQKSAIKKDQDVIETSRFCPVHFKSSFQDPPVFSLRHECYEEKIEYQACA